MAAKPRKRKAAKPAEPAKMGRPELYTQELADTILDRMACGETLTQISNDAGMPHRSTVRRWLARYPDFCTAYTRARELLADVYAEQAIEIADDASGDITTDAKGKPTVDWETVQRSRLRCDMRRWFAAKLAPRKYGEKIAHVGPDNGPIEVTSPMLPEDVALALAALLGNAERDMGLPSGEGRPDRERLDLIRSSGQPIPPPLYSALHQVMRKPNDAVH
jgi:hypothetical protein